MDLATEVLIEQREQARAIAVELENECAVLTDERDALLLQLETALGSGFEMITKVGNERDRALEALAYIAAPTMGVPAGADAAAFAMYGATDTAVRVALRNCIWQARSVQQKQENGQ